MAHKSASEAKNDLETELGQEFGGKLYWLGNAFTNLCVEWRIFRGLFASSKEAVDELNKASGLVAEFTSKALFESVILGLCRMTDPAETGRGNGAKPNLSLEAICKNIPDNQKDEFCGLVESARAATEFARDWRNRLFAHADLHVATKNSNMKPATIKKVDKAFSEIDVALNFANSLLQGKTVMYADAISQLDDERTFLRSLYLGNRAWNDLRERKKRA